MSKIVEPVIMPDSHHDTRSTHPAFAQITVHRSQGSGRSLYASDLQHHASLTIRIHESELCRGLSHDWRHQKREYIEVELSEAQWAAFVSSVGMGGGVPCTLRHFNGENIAGLPAPRPRSDQFSAEIVEDMARILKRCDDLAAGAKNKAQLSEINQLRQELEQNLPFVAKSFAKQMEATVEAAKSEVHGYMTGAIHRAGLDVLGAQMPLAIEGKTP